MAQQADYMFKMILLGSSTVGKSSILLRFTRGQFSQTLKTTIGVQYASKTVQANGKKIKLQIWDTAGQQQYKAIMRTFYKGASAILMVYDVTNNKTFDDLDYWHQQIKIFSKSEIVIMLVGNKSDMQHARTVTKQKGFQYAQAKKIAFYEVSAKQNTNIDLIFVKIAEQLQKLMTEAQKIKNTVDTTNNQNKQHTQPKKQSAQQKPKTLRKSITQSKNNKKNCQC